MMMAMSLVPLDETPARGVEVVVRAANAMRALVLTVMLLLSGAFAGCMSKPQRIDDGGVSVQEPGHETPEGGDNNTSTQGPNPTPEPEPEKGSETDWSKECLSDHLGLAMHIHPRLVIQIENDSYLLGADTGIDTEVCPDSMHIVHTHDDSGKLHVETPEPTNITLDVFFEIWGVAFNETRIANYFVNDTHELVMKVDDTMSDEWGSHVFSDGETILIHYRERE